MQDATQLSGMTVNNIRCTVHYLVLANEEWPACYWNNLEISLQRFQPPEYILFLENSGRSQEWSLRYSHESVEDFTPTETLLLRLWDPNKTVSQLHFYINFICILSSSRKGNNELWLNKTTLTTSPSILLNTDVDDFLYHGVISVIRK